MSFYEMVSMFLADTRADYERCRTGKRDYLSERYAGMVFAYESVLRNMPVEAAETEVK